MEPLIYLTDGYKLDHRRQYPPDVTHVYSNFTPRSKKYSSAENITFFGLQYFVQKYFEDWAAASFFYESRPAIEKQYKKFLNSYLGPDNGITTKHIAALHELGYIPLEFSALPEGTPVPVGVPMFVFENTHAEFPWVTNYFETLISSVLWQACTSATTARRFRFLLEEAALLTGGPTEFVQWQGHDFSFRGMASPDAAALSGAAHLLYFTGTDAVPAIQLIEEHYGMSSPDLIIGGSVPATEHSVMCAGKQDKELDTFERLLKLYPTGIVSVVSDTWDLWNVVDNILPQLRDKILARDGKLVIRPDSGDPADILCGDSSAPVGSSANVGLIRALYQLFGGRKNAEGFIELDPHIGAIYGDSITLSRAEEIVTRLRASGFASTNVVLGIGSYTYQHVTRDTHGFAIKSTWVSTPNESYAIQKAPATDASKRSLSGRIAVRAEQGYPHLIAVDGLLTREQSQENTLLVPVWRDGALSRHQTFDEVRNTAMLGLALP